MIIYIGSKNPAKIDAVKNIFSSSDSIISQDVPSNVSPQPFSDEETRQGAINRSLYLIKNFDAEVAIGLEGGVIDTSAGLQLCNWGALATEEGDLFFAGGARIPLTPQISQKVKAGMELGDAIDIWTKRTEVRKKEGTIGVLTAGEVTRVEMFEHVVRILVGQWKFAKQTSRVRKE
ncbi:DUF84 family protein [Evansella sp. AB-P1]|uniref:DUF84 family protein n=1 Tax=Evansella sp. AB-P1 TaxID=3037653 RepID=UPI00241C55C9|nr:DUF84 family protein [Evansella sp. AB-P1]MDG5787724.1 DUF84 family protein [Evansella sp. AB-P1]